VATFLQLVQKLRQECQIAGTGPTSVVGQTGELKQLVDWTIDAYSELQSRNGGHWRWLRRDFTFDTTSGVDTYAPTAITDVDDSALITRFSAWRNNDWEDPPKIFQDSVGIGSQRWMIWVPYEWFKQIYRIGAQTDGFPHHITTDPRDNLLIGPKIANTHTITGEYWRSPQILALDVDVPEMPTQYHNLIVYRAMEKYAGAEAAPEVMTRAKNEGRPLLRQLEKNQLARFRKGGPLA
jgi:hypothetical protein